MNEGLNPKSEQSLVTPKEHAKSLEQILREKAPDVLNSIPKDKRPKLSHTVSVQEVVIRGGPLPEPAELAAYNQIIPDGANRIMKMAEAQSSHRIGIEKLVIASQQSQASRGQIFGFIIGLTGLGLGTYAAICGQPWFGATIGSATLVSLVSAFLYSQQRQKRDLASKRQQVDESPRKSSRK